MRIERKSVISGKVYVLDLPVTEEEIKRWASGEYAQQVWPHLTPDQREFIISGATKAEWDETFSEPDGPEVELGEEPSGL